METFLNTSKDKWKDMTQGQFDHYSGKFINTVKSDLGIKSQKSIGSTNDSDPQNKKALGSNESGGKNSDKDN
jgi:hypothetical protein